MEVWNIRTTECAPTLDEHTGNLIIYSGYISNIFTQRFGLLAGSMDGSLLISGGADLVICFWQDITEKVQHDEVAKLQQLLLRYDMLGIY